MAVLFWYLVSDLCCRLSLVFCSLRLSLTLSNLWTPFWLFSFSLYSKRFFLPVSLSPLSTPLSKASEFVCSTRPSSSSTDHFVWGFSFKLCFVLFINFDLFLFPLISGHVLQLIWHGHLHELGAMLRSVDRQAICLFDHRFYSHRF